MSSRRDLLRLELAAFALAATVILVMLVVTLDAVRFHLPALEANAPGTLPLLIVLAVEAMIVVVLTGSFARQVVRQRALRRRLPSRSMLVHGSEVFVVPTSRPLAFCLGLLRPRIYLSEGLLGDLSASELLSVVAHERHHARRRDPLRAVLAKATAQALWFVPTVKTAASAQATIAELAADQFAIRTAGAQPLASALAAFDRHGGPSAVAPLARMQLARGAPRATSAEGVTVGAALVLLALVLTAGWLLLPDPLAICLPLATDPAASLGALLLACIPAALLARSASSIGYSVERQ
jgi:Zn-dependent protease with chaperone function